MKQFILDTNVLLYDPKALQIFEDNEVIIPISVLDELDDAKVRLDEVGRNARHVVKMLDDLRSKGSLNNGVKFGNSLIRVELNHRNHIPKGLSEEKKDNRLISTAIGLQGKGEVIVVSKDINLRVKCDALGIEAQDYIKDKVAQHSDSIYSGYKVIETTAEFINSIYKKEFVDFEVEDGFENQFFIFKSGSQSAITRYKNGKLEVCRIPKEVWGVFPRNVEQKMALILLNDPDIKLVSLIGLSGSGKAQPIDSLVLTPNGWEKIGKINSGNLVMCPDGTVSKVSGVYPQGKKEVYKVYFSDGTSTECCKEHLWKVQTANDRCHKKDNWEVKTLEEISKDVKVCNKRNYSIPMVEKINFPKKKLPIDSYILGALLGDGSFRHFCSFSSQDYEIVDFMKKKLTLRKKSRYDYYIGCACSSGGPAPIPVVRINKNGKTKEYSSIKDAVRDGFSESSIGKVCCGKQTHHRGFLWKYIRERKKHSKHELKNTLIDLGLFNKRSEEKFIPNLYKFAPYNERVSLLQGLLDTDGTVEGRNNVYLSTSSPLLKDDVKELAQSLGAKVTINIKKNPKYTYRGENKISKKDNYIVRIALPPNIQPFRLTRKKNKYIPRTKYKPTRYIDRIEKLGLKECVCINVDHPDHLYITNDYIVTHNTLMATAAALDQVINTKQYKRVLMSRPIQPVGKDIGYLPGSIGEKLKPWMQPIYDNLEFLFGSDYQIINEYEHLGLLQVEPLTYIRGRSIPNSLMLMDESQNLSGQEVKTVITRMGENSKIILTGDILQIDAPYIDFADNGLTYIVESFKEYSIAGHITFRKGERSELATLASKIL